MTTKDFLKIYDSKSYFAEEQLEDLWWGNLLDIEIPVVGKEEYGEPDRWDTCVSKVIKIEDRCFMIYKLQGNTEYQETTYPYQPEEVKPVEKTIICWERII